MPKTFYTIGYEGTDIERFISTLVAVGVRTVADVRAVPHSRKKGFSKQRLRAALAEADIAYEHFLDLGDPREGREAARMGDYDRFRAVFSAHMDTSNARAALDDLARLADASATCLLCFERDPQVCHRSIIALRLQDRGMKVFDLYGDAPSRYVHHAHRVPRHSAGQGAPTPE
ncbi:MULTISPECIES: DUF488 family protein, N3 subclade [unclassified Methylobacterium]|uniref:DUF488 family protein, N3 subclade n=1 Tax=unclassified Methylobacterium TaxID=2615210 RepID=UPI0013548AB2|nr:DUF488 domain-containing protein [Methylobacterium sp. 2A]